MRENGTQVCIDLFGCKEILLNDSTFLEKLIDKAIKESGLVPVEKIKLHKFNPHGVTGYALLASSHIAIHTWPEHNYTTIDVFACDNRRKVMKAAEIFIKGLKPKKVKKTILIRGYIVK